MRGEGGRYAASLASKDIDYLMDQLVSGEKGNSFGSHDEQIALVRAEIIKRVR